MFEQSIERTDEGDFAVIQVAPLGDVKATNGTLEVFHNPPESSGVNANTPRDTAEVKLDSEGQVTLRIPLKNLDDKVFVRFNLRPCGTGTAYVSPAAMTPIDLRSSTGTPEPSGEDEAQPMYVASIEGDREHFVGESDAIWRVCVDPATPGIEVTFKKADGSNETKTTNDQGCVEFRQRVTSYGDYEGSVIAMRDPSGNYFWDDGAEQPRKGTASVR